MRPLRAFVFSKFSKAASIQRSLASYEEKIMEQKWIDLSDTLIKAGKYYLPRLTSQLLSSRYDAGCAVIREVPKRTGNRIEAYAALWQAYEERLEDWMEVGTVFVSPAIAGNGVCGEIMREIVALAPADKNLFLVTDVMPVMRAAEELRFVPVTLETFTIPIKLVRELLGPDRKIPESICPHCFSGGRRTFGVPKNGERWFFYRPA